MIIPEGCLGEPPKLATGVRSEGGLMDFSNFTSP